MQHVIRLKNDNDLQGQAGKRTGGKMTAKKISKVIHDVLPNGHCRLNMSDGALTRIFNSRVRKGTLEVRVIHGHNDRPRWWAVAANESVTVGTLSPYEETFVVGGI